MPNSGKALEISETSAGEESQLNKSHSSVLVLAGEMSMTKPKFPKAVGFIMVNELCERFSFYGLKAILAIYLVRALGMSEDESTTSLHLFVTAAYFFPLLGGFISDRFLGKYLTILILSIVYCIGGACLAITAIPGVVEYAFFAYLPNWWGVGMSLFLIALGTGGIKPCVSSFIGDQFSKDQAVLLDKVFSAFYFCINLGSLLSTLLTPILREEFSFAVAFAVPAILLGIATIIFVSGTFLYKHVKPGTNVFKTVLLVVLTAWWYRIASCFGQKFQADDVIATVEEEEEEENEEAEEVPTPVDFPADATLDATLVGGDPLILEVLPEKPASRHWLEWASPRYSADTIGDVKSTLNILVVFLPLPVFWALFDQHASRFIFQAEKMNRSVFGLFTIQPDQVPVLNPLFLLMMIPILNKIVYPLCQHFVDVRPLRKMAVGMLLTSFSFVLAALVEFVLNYYTLHVIFQVPQYWVLSCGEVLVSITGLELGYSQAPTKMKAVVAACWLLTTSVGNLLVALVAEANICNQTCEFSLFAFLMFVFFLIFIPIAMWYKYKDYVGEAETEEKEISTKDGFVAMSDSEDSLLETNGLETESLPASVDEAD